MSVNILGWDKVSYGNRGAQLLPGKDVGGCDVKNLPPDHKKVTIQRPFDIGGGGYWMVDFGRDLRVRGYQPRM